MAKIAADVMSPLHFPKYPAHGSLRLNAMKPASWAANLSTEAGLWAE